MVKRKASLANPKHQYHVYQCGEHVCGANNKMNGDYYEYQVCLISWMNFDCRENGGKKSLSCKSEASISYIPMWRTLL